MVLNFRREAAVDVDAADAASRSVDDARLSRDSANTVEREWFNQTKLTAEIRKTSTDPSRSRTGPRLLRTYLRTCLSGTASVAAAIDRARADRGRRKTA
ncbi:MAG: hypothetical protein IPG80_04555 [Anaerolineales bacterium]|uniref:hypothetical protein n=1 Tax=Candidatus Villigracilis vicinus TaxID=3140679 RepID=UPI00313548B8|nr:hypothetical protein [Anaerolineales bacterium]